MPVVIGAFFAITVIVTAVGWIRAVRRDPSLMRWTMRDIVVASALAVAIGMLFIAWSWITELLKFIPEPFSAWSVGFWMIAGRWCRTSSAGRARR